MSAPLLSQAMPLSFIPDSKAGFIIDISYSVSAFSFVLVILGNCEVRPRSELRYGAWRRPARFLLLAGELGRGQGVGARAATVAAPPPRAIFFFLLTVCQFLTRCARPPSPVLGQHCRRTPGARTLPGTTQSYFAIAEFGGKLRVKSLGDNPFVFEKQ